MKPSALQLGDKIGIVAPASPSEPACWKKAVTILMLMGYQIEIGESVKQVDGYLAGTDEVRANDLNQMFANPSIKAIFCLRGGYGVMRILHLLDYDIIKENPKIVIGYSDITALHLSLYQKTGLVTFHGPVAAELANGFHPLTAVTLFSLCTIPHSTNWQYPVSEDAHTITAGRTIGKLIGGNLSLIAATLGTPYEINTEGKILFLEDVGEAPYRIDRMLTQLWLAEKLQSARGIILTSFTNCKPANPQKSKTLSEVFDNWIRPLGIPAFFGLQAGHTSPNMTLPIGGTVSMDATKCRLTCLEGYVQS